MNYGCHNRNPYLESRVAPDLYVLSDGLTELAKKTAIPFVLSRECQYTESGLGKKDAGCTGCIWRKS